MHKKLSIKFLVLFFMGILLCSYITASNNHKPSTKSGYSVSSNDGNYQLVKSNNQNLEDLSYSADDIENDSEYEGKVKSSYLLIDSCSIAKALSYSKAYSFSIIGTLKIYKEKIFLIIRVFRL